MLRIVGLCFVLAAVSTTPAAASDWWKDIERAGPVVAASASIGGMLSVHELETGSIEVDRDLSYGAHVKAGYRLPRWLQGDLHFEVLVTEQKVTGGSIDPNPEDPLYVFTGDFKLLLPRWGNGEFYLIAGPGMMNIDGVTEFAARFGGGVDMYLTRSIGFNIGASYVMPIDELENYDYCTADIGFFYRF